MIDERVWQIVVATLGASVFVATLSAFAEVPKEFWAVPPAVFTFLSAAVAFSNKNGNGRHDSKKNR